MKTVKIKYFTERNKQSGATLIIIIISIIVLTVIGVAIYSLTSTATRSQVVAQGAAKAFYIAESGIRIASSEFRVVPQIVAGIDNYVARNNKLISLQGLVFPLPNNQGEFLLDMSPDWCYALTAQSGATITLYFPGSVRSGLTFPTGGILKRKGYTNITLNSFFNSVPVTGSFSAPNGTPITFTFPGSYPYTFNVGDEGYIGYAFNPSPSSPQTVNSGGNLVLNNTNNRAAIFPPENGTIYIEHIATYPAPPNGSGLSYPVISQYTYDVRIPYVIDPSSPPATVTLQNIQAVAGTPAAFPLIIVYSAGNLTTLTLTSRIYLGKTLAIQSTSTYGD
jgi:hypothetical protein